MAENSKIEWCDHTFNPWRGCTKVSDGCKHCYADQMSKRNPKTLGVWGPNGTRVVAAEAAWKQPVKWNRVAAETGVRARVFCASLADVFEDWQGQLTSATGNPLWINERGDIEHQAMSGRTDSIFFDQGFKPLRMDDVRRRLFALIDSTPHLDWILVTKRPENILRMWPDCSVGELSPTPHSDGRGNVWLLTSVENQEQAAKRIPELLKCRDLSPVLGLSCEPLLGPVDLAIPETVQWCNACSKISATNKLVGKDFECGHCGDPRTREREFINYLNWVIVGGESGHNARPVHPQWVRSLRNQCTAADVPYFFKQWGEWAPYTNEDHFTHCGEEKHAHAWVDSETGDSGACWIVDDDGLWSNWTGNPRIVGEGEIHHSVAVMGWHGKKAAGRLLDGKEWSQFPQVKTQ